MVTEKQPGAVPGLLEELRALLDRELAGEDGVIVTTQYPFQQRRLPPDRPVVWLGVEKIAAAGSCFSPPSVFPVQMVVTGSWAAIRWAKIL